MSRQVSREEMRAWLDRWKEVNRVTTEEARALTPKEKFRQLETLFEAADLFEWPASDEIRDQRVRDLWMRLHALTRC
jgi:hypothetical protein